MKIYIGNVGTLKYLELMKENGWGCMYLANAFRYPKKGIDWALDNGAYSCWIHSKPFDADAFRSTLYKLEKCSSRPDFIVCPDIVAGGYDSLKFSLKWLHEIPAGYLVYLAVQDGMEETEIKKHIHLFDGLFVGGMMKWKMKTASSWIKLAHENDIKAHIGRVGTLRRLLFAKAIGADSIDSSTFVQAKKGKGFERIKSAISQNILKTSD